MNPLPVFKAMSYYYLVVIRKHWMAIIKFSDRKQAPFRFNNKINCLCGHIHRYAAQGNPQIDATTAKKAVSG